MQDACFNHEDFNQFTIARSANLVLYHSLKREDSRSTSIVSGALERQDEVLFFPELAD
jgi:hypothetical protein